jgi:sugar phosphate isomerase/epimerase
MKILPATAALGMLPQALRADGDAFQISLAQWSLHQSFFGDSLKLGWSKFAELFSNNPDSVLQGPLNPVDFASIARNEFAIDAIEYVNTFFFNRARNEAFIDDLRRRADDAGVRSLLIMCDRLGSTGAATASERTSVVENHRPWLEAAARLGCKAVRVNAYGTGEANEVARNVADSLNQLATLADPLGLFVLVENHGGLSSNGAWLAGVMVAAAHPRVGTLPDFGNFRLSERGAVPERHYDRYLGVTELMPYARAVSAKSYDFDEAGNETTIDYQQMLEIVVAAGYSGHVGIEYEGSRLSEFDGIRATKKLLERVREVLADG